MIKRISANYTNSTQHINSKVTKNNSQTFRAKPNNAQEGMSFGAKLSFGLTVAAAIAMGVLALKRHFATKKLILVKNSNPINNLQKEIKQTVSLPKTTTNPDGSFERVFSNGNKVKINPFRNYSIKKLPSGEEQTIPFKKGTKEQIIEVFDKNGEKIMERTRIVKKNEIYNDANLQTEIFSSESKTELTNINTKNLRENTSKMKEFDVENYKTYSHDGKMLAYNTKSRIYYTSNRSSEIEKEYYRSTQTNYNNLKKINEKTCTLNKDNRTRTKNRKTERYVFENNHKKLESIEYSTNDVDYVIKRDKSSFLCTKKQDNKTITRNVKEVNLENLEANFG